jgi:hypothetical protein
VLQASLRWAQLILPNDTASLKIDAPRAITAHFQAGVTLMFALGFNINLGVVHAAIWEPKQSSCYNCILAAQRTRQPVPIYPAETSFSYIRGLAHSGIRQFPAATAAVGVQMMFQFGPLYKAVSDCQALGKNFLELPKPVGG